MGVGNKIKNFLAENDILQTELSISAKIPLPKLNLMLCEKRRIKMEEYETICYVLNVPVGTFLEAKKPMKIKAK